MRKTGREGRMQREDAHHYLQRFGEFCQHHCFAASTNLSSRLHRALKAVSRDQHARTGGKKTAVGQRRHTAAEGWSPVAPLCRAEE
eukprot:5310587-Pyramimonas_sp.AAC.1